MTLLDTTVLKACNRERLWICKVRGRSAQSVRFGRCSSQAKRTTGRTIPMMNRIWRIARHRNRWVGVVFLCYVALVFAFGAVYQYVFGKDQRAFTFNSDITRSQSRAVEETSLRQLGRLTAELKVLHQLKDELGLRTSPPIVRLTANARFDTSTIRGSRAEYVVMSPVGPTGGDPYPGPVLVMKPLGGGGQQQIYGDWLFFQPKNIDGFRRLTDMWIQKWEADRSATKAILQSLSTDAPNVWSYWDFLYFSAITQFTVGYGDMLPNSTPVRMIVVLQTCMAAALLIIALNFAFANKSQL